LFYPDEPFTGTFTPDPEIFSEIQRRLVPEGTTASNINDIVLNTIMNGCWLRVQAINDSARLMKPELIALSAKIDADPRPIEPVGFVPQAPTPKAPVFCEKETSFNVPILLSCISCSLIIIIFSILIAWKHTKTPRVAIPFHPFTHPPLKPNVMPSLKTIPTQMKR
jgi:hypothetical protein